MIQSRTLMLVGVIGLLVVNRARAQTAADTAGIRMAAMNYIEGWYTADADRMAKALHPELAKRMVRSDSTMMHSQLNQQSAMTLVTNTRNGGGKSTPEAERRKDLRILDIYHGAAVAKIVASGWIDYLELARWNGEWRIVNVLWELTPAGEHPKP